MKHLIKIFKNKKVTPVEDLRTGKNNDGELLFKAEKPYKVITVVDKPTPYCFILKNERGCYDMIHISKIRDYK